MNAVPLLKKTNDANHKKRFKTMDRETFDRLKKEVLPKIKPALDYLQDK